MKTGMAKTLLIGVIALSLCITRRREGNGIYEQTYSPFIIITDIKSTSCITGFALTGKPPHTLTFASSATPPFDLFDLTTFCPSSSSS